MRIRIPGTRYFNISTRILDKSEYAYVRYIRAGSVELALSDGYGGEGANTLDSYPFFFLFFLFSNLFSPSPTEDSFIAPTIIFALYCTSLRL